MDTTTATLDERIEQGINSVFCPACKAPEGSPCVTPKGKVAKLPHQRRVEFASACNRVPVA
jgi:hypothetical protein